MGVVNSQKIALHQNVLLQHQDAGESDVVKDEHGLRKQTCEFCLGDFRIGLSECPHCGRPRLYPNAKIATSPEEIAGLERLYRGSADIARKNNQTEIAARFVERMAHSNAVVNCPPSKILPIVNGHVELYATFLELQTLRCSASNDTKDYPRLRGNAEVILLESSDHKHRVQYASLTTGKVGLTSYGEVSLRFKEAMIHHRASIFPSNSALYFEKRDQSMPGPGLRISWENRGKAALVKHVSELQNEMVDADLDSLVLKKGLKMEDDVMMEVHVLGPITIRTFASVVFSTVKSGQSFVAKLMGSLGFVNIDNPAPAYIKQFRDYCNQHHISFEVHES